MALVADKKEEEEKKEGEGGAEAAGGGRDMNLERGSWGEMDIVYFIVHMFKILKNKEKSFWK